LNDLRKKNTPFAWKEAQQTAFDTLKNRFTTAPIHAYPDNDWVFRLETDASNFATGAVLSIEQNGQWHPVAFSSHSMFPEECNYPVLHWVCVENSLKHALKSRTRTPGSEDKKTPEGLWIEEGIGQSRRRRTKPLGLRQTNPGKSGLN
jgi:hypothetical protein